VPRVQQRVRLAAAELCRHVEDGGRFDGDPGQSPDRLYGEVGQVAGKVGAVEEAGGFEVVAVDILAPLADVLQVDREF